MTSEADREAEQDQRRLAAAYSHVAAAHDQAAQMHEKVAAYYDTHGNFTRAMYERWMAAQERRSAVADRKWVATLSPKTEGGTRRSSEDLDRPGLHGADLAALLGATITVLLTLTGNPGAWGILSTIIGMLLLVLLVTFFWRRRPGMDRQMSLAQQYEVSVGERGKWARRWAKSEPFLVGAALSVVIGCAAAIAGAQELQSQKFPDKPQTECRSVAVAAATTTARDLSDINARKGVLHHLVTYTLVHGHETGKAVDTDPVLDSVFYHQYDATVGDCLANETFDKLRCIAVPASLLAFLWWSLPCIIKLVRKRKAV